VPLPLIRHTQETTKEVIYFSFVLNFVLIAQHHLACKVTTKKANVQEKKSESLFLK
jgi:hypothetical protein